MIRPTNIFPTIECYREKDTLALKTTIRKKHRGKWYFWQFNRNAYVPEGRTDYTAAISSFTRDVHLGQTIGKIDPEATYKDGTKIFPLDSVQISEKERLDPKRRGVEIAEAKK